MKISSKYLQEPRIILYILVYKHYFQSYWNRIPILHSSGFQIFVDLIESATVTKKRSAKNSSQAQGSMRATTSFFAKPYAGSFAGSKCWRALESSPAISSLSYPYSLFRWSDPDATLNIYTLISAVFTFLPLRSRPIQPMASVAHLH